jgi:hypothetical protein
MLVLSKLLGDGLGERLTEVFVLEACCFPHVYSPIAPPPRWTCQPMVPDYRTHSQLEHGWTVLSILNPMFGKQSLLNQPKAQCF